MKTLIKLWLIWLQSRSNGNQQQKITKRLNHHTSSKQAIDITFANNVYNSYQGASSFWLSSRKPKRPLLIRGYIQDLCLIYVVYEILCSDTYLNHRSIFF